MSEIQWTRHEQDTPQGVLICYVPDRPVDALVALEMAEAMAESLTEPKQ